MARRKQVLAVKSKAQRKAARKETGPLINLVVTPRTLARYNLALKRFFAFLHALPYLWPRSFTDLDSQLSSFVELCWEEGDPVGYASDAICGVQHYLPRARRHLACSWRLLGAWKKHELPCRATPFLPAFVAAVAGWFCAHSLPGTAAALLLGFHCLLRTQEFVSAQWAHLTIQKKSSIAVLLLPNTKSGQRFGHEESVVISDSALIQMLLALSKARLPGDTIMEIAGPRFRSLFAQAVRALPLPRGDWKPYSCRRGGATQHYRLFASLDATCVRGRWANTRTCRLYINDAIAALNELQITPGQTLALEKWQKHLPTHG